MNGLTDEAAEAAIGAACRALHLPTVRTEATRPSSPLTTMAAAGPWSKSSRKVTASESESESWC